MVRSHPLAGTAPRGGDPAADARLAAGLLASAKDRAEHQVTIDFVHQTLLPWCSFLDEEAEPSVVGVANVQHLGTMVEGQLSDPAPSVLELVEALHPTPAVGGDPRDAAVALIARLETGDRGRYAGPVGWVDGAGNGSWAVGIRSAELTGTDGHAVGRRRHRRRLRPRRRARGDPGQAPGHAWGPWSGSEAGRSSSPIGYSSARASATAA